MDYNLFKKKNAKQKEVDDIDKIFKKTVTKPHIYYLPLSEEEVKSLIYEVLNPIGYNLMVTPKEEDFIVEKLSDVISEGINSTLHKNVK